MKSAARAVVIGGGVGGCAILCGSSSTSPGHASRPTPSPNETGKLLNFHWHWLNDQPILWTVAIVITLVGAVYFVLVQRTKPAHLQAPEGEVFAEGTPLAAPASTAWLRVTGAGGPSSPPTPAGPAPSRV